MTPLKPLKSLTDRPKVTPLYTIPTNIMEYYIKKQKDWFIC